MKQEETGLIHHKYRVLDVLCELPYCKVYHVQDATNIHGIVNKIRCIVLEYDRETSPPSILKEVDMWLATGDSLFPAFTESWETGGKQMIVMDDLAGETIFNLPARDYTQPEGKVLHLFSPLKDLFERLSNMQVGLFNLDLLVKRVIYIPPGMARLLPSSLSHVLEKGSVDHQPVSRNQQKIPESDYIQAFASLLCYLITQEFPNDKEVPSSASNLLKQDTLEFLKFLVSGKIKNFKELDLRWGALHDAKTAKGETAPAAVSAKKMKPRRRGMLSWLFLGKERKAEDTRKSKSNKRPPFRWIRRVSQWDLVVFTRSLAVMVGEGIPMLTALRHLAGHVDNYVLRDVIRDLILRLGTGRGLSESFAAHPEVFSRLYIGMIQEAEVSGQIEDILIKLSEYMEQELQFWKKIKSALTYPFFVALGAFLVLFIMYYFIFPNLVRTFEELHISLPWMTQLLVAFSRLISKPLVPVLFFAALFLAYRSYKAYTRTWIGRSHVDKIRYKIFFFGKCWKLINIIHFSYCFSALYRVGIPVMSILRIFKSCTESPVLEKVTEDLTDGLKLGLSFKEAVDAAHRENNEYFPRTMLSLMDVIEHTGEVEAVFDLVGQNYRMELDFMLGKFLAFFEPVIIVLLGIAVGFIMVSVFLPIYSLVSNFQ